MSDIVKKSEGNLEKPQGELEKFLPILELSKFNNLSDNTKKAYKYSLWDFCKFISIRLQFKIDEGIRDEEIPKVLRFLYTKKAIEVELLVAEYIKHLKEKSQSTSTIAAKFAAIRDTFESWNRLFQNKINLSDIKPPKIEKRKIRGPKPEEFEKILEEIDKKFDSENYSDKRDALLFYIMNFCGLRISEVLSIDIDLNLLKEGRLEVLRKGKQELKVDIPVPPETKKKIEQFLLIDGRKKGPLFIGIQKKKRLSRQSAFRRLIELTEKAIGKKLSPHKFRHFYATEALEATDHNKDLAMKFTGHKSREVFDRYEDERNDYAKEIGIKIEEKWTKGKL